MYKYPFTNALTFALVMQDLEMSKGLLQLIFPERKIKELRRHGPDEIMFRNGPGTLMESWTYTTLRRDRISTI